MRKEVEITNQRDMIDSRDVIERINYLQDERATLKPNVIAEWDEGEEGQELKTLKKLREEAESCGADWNHGVTLIRDSYFKEYAQQFADDIGVIDTQCL